MYLPDHPSDTSIKNDLWYICDSFGKKSEIVDNFSINKQKYSYDEFGELWWSVPWALYLLSYRPEILKYKGLFEAIRKTKKIHQITLEWEWSKWFVVQLSDICIKFNNDDIHNTFEAEYNNYKLIEECYKQLWKNNYFDIPILEHNLCSDKYITMEYIPWFTLLVNNLLKKYKINSKMIYEFIHKNAELDDYDDLLLIKYRLKSHNVDINNIMSYIKEHELITVLIYMWVDESFFIHSPTVDPLEFIAWCFTENTKQYVDIYKKRQQILHKNWILSIEDHGGNLKIYNDRLYWLDFWNVTYTNKHKWNL